MREQYLAMRKSGQYKTNWFYKYFTEKGGKGTFQVFSIAMQQLDLQTILNYLDVEYALSILYSKDKQILNIY